MQALEWFHLSHAFISKRSQRVNSSAKYIKYAHLKNSPLLSYNPEIIRRKFHDGFSTEADKSVFYSDFSIYVPKQ